MVFSAGNPAGIAIEANGNILALDNAGPDGLNAVVVRVDPSTGAQTLVSSGGLLPNRTDTQGIAVEPAGDILVGTLNGLIRVNAVTGAQTMVSSSVAVIDIAVVPAPEAIQVQIDIKPGSFPNSINLGSGGTVPVAIFSTTDFDATTVDPTTVTLASAPVQLKGKGTPMVSFADINDDGLLDLVVHVSTEALQLNETDTEATLEGKTFNGTAIQGTDSVRIVP